MKYEYILFDLDGTLFNYDLAEREALIKTFGQFGITCTESYLDKYREINIAIWIDFENGRISQKDLKAERFARLSKAIEKNFDATDFSNRYLHNLSEGTQLIDGSENVIRQLYERAELFLITNGLTIVQKPRIAYSSIGKYFKDSIISEEVGVAKPDTRIFDIAFEKMGRPQKSDVLIVGDSLTSDMQGGINYGIDTCWFNPNNVKNEQNLNIIFQIEHLSELLKIARLD